VTWGVFSNEAKFWAEAAGPNRVYNAGESGVFKYIAFEGPMALEPDIRQACDDLVSKLVAKGWEQEPGKGDKWWKYRFRRRLK
jgi:hypothetical protein